MSKIGLADGYLDTACYWRASTGILDPSAHFSGFAVAKTGGPPREHLGHGKDRRHCSVRSARRSGEGSISLPLGQHPMRPVKVPNPAGTPKGSMQSGSQYCKGYRAKLHTFPRVPRNREALGKVVRFQHVARTHEVCGSASCTSEMKIKRVQ